MHFIWNNRRWRFCEWRWVAINLHYPIIISTNTFWYLQTEFHNLDSGILLKALQALEIEKKAELFSHDGSDGVKFFWFHTNHLLENLSRESRTFCYLSVSIKRWNCEISCNICIILYLVKDSQFSSFINGRLPFNADDSHCRLLNHFEFYNTSL